VRSSPTRRSAASRVQAPPWLTGFPADDDGGGVRRCSGPSFGESRSAPRNNLSRWPTQPVRAGRGRVAQGHHRVHRCPHAMRTAPCGSRRPVWSGRTCRSLGSAEGGLGRDERLEAVHASTLRTKAIWVELVPACTRDPLISLDDAGPEVAIVCLPGDGRQGRRVRRLSCPAHRRTCRAVQP